MNVLNLRPRIRSCPHPTERKMRKTNRVVIFFFLQTQNNYTNAPFFVRKCQIWAKNLLKFIFNCLKKHFSLRFNCILPAFSPFRNFNKKYWKTQFSKKKKKKSSDRPNFQIVCMSAQHNNYFLHNDAYSKFHNNVFLEICDKHAPMEEKNDR